MEIPEIKDERSRQKAADMIEYIEQCDSVQMRSGVPIQTIFDGFWR